MTGALLLVPFFLVRFGLLAALDRTGVGRAARFAPLSGRVEQAAYWVYQISNAAILLLLLFLRPQVVPGWLFAAGAAGYGGGLGLLAASVAAFAAPAESGLNRRGAYRYSRNPMYLAYFLFFLGCAALTRSWVLLGLTLAFQGAAHWIILAEERWCLEHFGEEYQAYTSQVRRYF